MVHERLGDFLRLGFWGGEAKISLGPQRAAHQGEGVAEGRLSLGVPGGGADGTGASRAGVVRAMAKSFHCRWVSMPRWARHSSKVTSSCQRCTNQARICAGAVSYTHL